MTPHKKDGTGIIGPAVLYLDDLERIDAILKGNGLKVEFATDEMTYDSFGEMRDHLAGSEVDALRIKAERDGASQIIMWLGRKQTGTIFDGSGSNEGRGLCEQIKDVVSSRLIARWTAQNNTWGIAAFILGVVLFVFVRKYEVGGAMWMVAAVGMVFISTSNRRNPKCRLILKKKHEAPSFFESSWKDWARDAVKLLIGGVIALGLAKMKSALFPEKPAVSPPPSNLLHE